MSLGVLALCLPLPDYYRYSVALLALIAFCSSTHDIAADGLYIASLSSKQQAAYAGWQGGFYNIARFVSQGGLLILAGYLEDRMPVVRAWMMIFGTVGITLVVLSLFHSRVLPSGGEERHSRHSARHDGDILGRGRRFLQEAEHLVPAAFRLSVSRRRRTGGQGRSAVSEGGARPRAASG